jgi:YbbR domain-containing protein
MLTEAVSERVPVGGSSSTVLESVNVGSPDPAVRLRSPQSTKVTVQIRAAPAETVLSVEIRARHSKSAHAAVPRPSHVRVSVRGPHEVVSELQATAFEASVDVEGLGAGQHRVPVQVTAPAHVTVVNVEPVLVQVQVR